jgi:hypothetical protein
MDCPICFDAITSETGQVTTSCGHSFHFKCLNHWYYQQLQTDTAQESCPCCRKEPCPYERASTIDDENETATESFESESIEEEPHLEWVRIAPRRWIISSSEDRLRILAQVAASQPKLDPLHIPPYNGEAHALWLLRTLFEEMEGEPQPFEPMSHLDRPKMVRRRRRSYGRTFWTHLGEAHKLKEIDGYVTD